LKAVDTNILARLIVQDDPDQLAMAGDLVAQGVIVPLTVLLELGWLLRSRFGFSRSRIHASITELLANPHINVGEAAAVGQAMRLYADGADFADAIHLVAARGAEAFLTFDHDVPDGNDLGVPTHVIGL
jgi:predicted nucleic-acid-binding protein